MQASVVQMKQVPRQAQVADGTGKLSPTPMTRSRSLRASPIPASLDARCLDPQLLLDEQRSGRGAVQRAAIKPASKGVNSSKKGR